MEIKEIIDRYEKRAELTIPRLRDFYYGDKTPFLIVQQDLGTPIFYPDRPDINLIVDNNLTHMTENLKIEWSDHLPFFEPWYGVGVYANAFGCKYVWQEKKAPDTHYKYHKIEEIRELNYPDWRKTSPIMNTILKCIDALKEVGQERIPISLTDTQSPFDTATLILDATEFLTHCYIEPETVHKLMKMITTMLIDFSQEQIKRIGRELLSSPGHLMTSFPGGRGISISDDNLAVSSPHINEEIALPYNDQIAEAFGGLAIHSCGPWAHTMSLLPNYNQIYMFDCAVDSYGDPNPNKPTAVGDAVEGTGLIAKVRIGKVDDSTKEKLQAIVRPGTKLVVEIVYEPDNQKANYLAVKNIMEELHGTRF